MVSVVPLPERPVSSLPSELPEQLRVLADLVESGKVTSLICTYTCDDEYRFMFPNSLKQDLVLADLTHFRVLRKFLID